MFRDTITHKQTNRYIRTARYIQSAAYERTATFIQTAALNKPCAALIKTVLAFILIAAIAIAFMPIGTFAAAKHATKASTTKSMTAYYQLVKSGKIVYCVSKNGLFRVNVKTKKVKNLYKTTGSYIKVSCLKKNGNYIYFMKDRGGTRADLYRVKAKSAKSSKLISLNENSGSKAYAISGTKIYCKYKYPSGNKIVMNLNGSNKKKTTAKIKMNLARTTDNATDYKVSGNSLVLPNGKKIKLK